MTLESPDWARFAALFPRSDPFVVSATSISMEDSSLTRWWMSCLRRGSPPVILTFLSPRGLHALTKLRISSYVRISFFGRKSWPFPNSSLGMQYLHLKLHLSVTEILRSLRGLPSLSSATSIGSGVR